MKKFYISWVSELRIYVLNFTPILSFIYKFLNTDPDPQHWFILVQSSLIVFLTFRHADQRLIYVNSPSMHGFINAKKRTNIAGQVAGQYAHKFYTYLLK